MKSIKFRQHKIWLTSRLTKLLMCPALLMLFFYATAATANGKVIKASGASRLTGLFINDESNGTILNLADKMIYTTTVASGENSGINPNSALAAGIDLVKMEQAGNTVTKK